MAQIAGTPFEHTFQDEAVADGDGDPMDVGGLAAVRIQIWGLSEGNANIIFEATCNDSHWQKIALQNSTNVGMVTETNSDGLFLCGVAGLSLLRCRIDNYMSGTITAIGRGELKNTPIIAV